MLRVRFPRVSTLSAYALGVLLAAPAAAADLVIYQTPAGRLVLSNRPLPAGVELRFRAPEGNQPAPRAEERGAEGAPSRPAPAPGPVPPGSLSAPAPHLSPTPVDTVALALITRGMSAADVRRTIGAPERVMELDPVVRLSSERSSATAGRVERSVWVYPGNAQDSGVVIWFVNGHVERVVRAR